MIILIERHQCHILIHILLYKKKQTNSLAAVLISTVSIRRVRLMHRFPLLCHCIVVRFVRIIATIIQSVRVHCRRIVCHLRSTNAVWMVPTARLRLIVVCLRGILHLRWWHDGVSGCRHNVVVLRWAARSIVLMDNCRYRRSRRGTGCRNSNCRRRWRWELWWAFWIMTWKESRNEIMQTHAMDRFTYYCWTQHHPYCLRSDYFWMMMTMMICSCRGTMSPLSTMSMTMGPYHAYYLY